MRRPRNKAKFALKPNGNGNGTENGKGESRPKPSKQAAVKIDLQAELDNCALQALLGDGSAKESTAAVLDSLRRFADAAQQSGRADAATFAQSLSALIVAVGESDGWDAPAVSKAVNDGISQLQQRLREPAAVTAPAPAEPAPPAPPVPAAPPAPAAQVSAPEVPPVAVVEPVAPPAPPAEAVPSPVPPAPAPEVREVHVPGGGAADTPAPGPAPESAPAPAFSANLLADRDLLHDVIVESKGHLVSVEEQVLTLEDNPEDRDTLHSIFRSFHTIKGLAGFLELTPMQEVAHEVETILDLARNGKYHIHRAAIDIILAGADYLGQSVQVLDALYEGKQPEPFRKNEDLIRRIRKVCEDGGEADAGAPAAAAPKPAQKSSGEGAEGGSPESGDSEETAADIANKAKRSSAEASTLRVDTGKLDYLVDMVGELVIAESMIRYNPDLRSAQTPRLAKDLTHLARVTVEVQRTAMAMRMLPIGRLFRKMVRLVRDLARKSGKEARLEMFGEDVEIDRTIVEELTDPLIHMLRNAIDHGLETPDVRVAAGKERTGTVTLKAYHQGAHVIVEVSDDGRGLDRAKILKKAISKGIITENHQLTDAEVSMLICAPGFSTAEQITDVSGRGVGMDVVNKQIQKLRGRMEIQSTLGKGTTFLLKMPLTLAIIDGLIVKVGSETYVMPLFKVREMFRPAEDMVFTVENQAEMVLFRDKLLPIVRLGRVFSVKPKVEKPHEGLLIVVEGDSRNFCLLVDELVGKQEVVIKSLGATMSDIPGVSGGAILGDGRVALILDIENLDTTAQRK